MPISVAVFVDQFPELTETFISGEVRELAAQGHRVHVEALARAAHPDEPAAAGIDVTYAGAGGRGHGFAALAWLAVRHPLRSLRDVAARRRWAREEPPRPLRRIAPSARRVATGGYGHVHAHFAAGAALDAMRVAALLGLPYSVMTHGYDVFQRPRNLREKHERAAFAVSACQYSVDFLRERVAPEAAPRIHRLVVGVDTGRIRRRRPHSGGRTVVSTGRLVEKKGFAHLLDAAAILRDRGRPLDALRIVGAGPLRPALEAQVTRLGLGDTVELCGGMAPQRALAVLEEADVFALACVVAADGDRDTMPVVVKEALALEIPVVVSDEVGLPELVRDGWGRLCPPGDAVALADALDELLALDPATRRAMGAAGRDFVATECSLAGGTARLAGLIAAARH